MRTFSFLSRWVGIVFVGCSSVLETFAQREILPLPPSAAVTGYYERTSYALPSESKFEVSGIAVLPDGTVALALRKGEIWILENPLDPPAQARYRQFATGLHEPLGLAWRDGGLYTTQRSEVTRLEDRDGDGKADSYQTAAKGWGVSGNYHEYAYGPAFDSEGNLWVTLNVTIGQVPIVWELRYGVVGRCAKNRVANCSRSRLAYGHPLELVRTQRAICLPPINKGTGGGPVRLFI
ncbi:MAG TPA: hypothetical protein PLN52_04470 [Opitutaceae bacterium]|nr:hypothetical protein [Opitutaceae bacterium]